MLLATHLVHIIDTNSELLARRWAQEVMQHKLTPGYSQLTEQELQRRAINVFSSLGRWIDRRFTSLEAQNTYFSLGKRRYREGFSVVELVVALSLEKQVLWDLVVEEGVLDSSYNVHAALELMVALTEFFDRALIHAMQGYEHEKATGDERVPRVHPTRSWFAAKPKGDTQE